MSTSQTSGTVQSGPQSGSGDNLADLIRQLTHQGTHLAEQQLNLVRAEMRESAAEAKAATGAMAGAAVVGIAGLGVTLMGLAYLLGDAIDNVGLGTLIVGVAALALGFILYSTGKSKIQATHLYPDRSISTFERTSQAARGNLTPESRP
jgi:hypothetical protein